MDVLILMGGWSPERAVSLRSGQAVSDACQRLGMSVETFDVQSLDDLAWLRQRSTPPLVFNLVHGVGGEDGVLATWLTHHGIPFVGSEATSSALAMDKYRSKLIFKALGLPVLPDVLIQSAADFTRLDDLTFPLCIKPNNQGSSVGVIRLNDQSDFEQAEAVLEAYGPLMAEPWAQGREYTVAWVDGVCFPVIGIMPQGDAFYDYHAKYQSSSTQYCIPSGLSDAIEHDLKAMTRRAVEGLGCRHWARADFIFDGDQPYLLEVNTIPGMTETSLVPKAAAADGVSFDALVRKILLAAASQLVDA